MAFHGYDSNTFQLQRLNQRMKLGRAIDKAVEALRDLALAAEKADIADVMALSNGFPFYNGEVNVLENLKVQAASALEWGALVHSKDYFPTA